MELPVPATNHTAKTRQTAFEALYRSSLPGLLRFAVRLLKDEQDAEDLLQQFYIQVWEKWDTLPAGDDIDGFLITWLRRMILNQIRADQIREKHIEAFIAVMLTHTEDTLPAIFEKETYRQIQEAAGTLPERMREVFIMNRLQHMSIPAIAAGLGISEQTVRNHLSAAISRIRSRVPSASLLTAVIAWTACVN